MGTDSHHTHLANQQDINSDGVSRREFLRKATRWGLLAASLGTVGALVARREDECERVSGSSFQNGAATQLETACGKCPLLVGCNLPPAQTARIQPATRPGG